MRRVFPFRPSENSLLVTYDVKGDTHDQYGKELHGKGFCASSQALVCRPRRRSETDFSVSSATSGDESSAASSSPRTALARERLFASFRKPSKDAAEYPVFTGGSSCVSSPRSRRVYLNSIVEADWKGLPEDRPACGPTSSSALLSLRDRGFKELHARLAERMQTSTQDTPCIRSNRPQAPEIRSNSGEVDQVPYRPPARHGSVQPTHHSRRPSLATSDKSRQSASESSSCFTKSSKRSSSLSSCSDSSSLKDDAASCKPRSTNSSFRCLSPCMLAGRVTRAWRKEKNPGRQAGGKVNSSAALASRIECSGEVRKTNRGGVLASSGDLQSPVSTGAQSMSADLLPENPVVRGEDDLPRSGRLGNPTSSGDSNLYEALQARAIAREELAARSDMESNLWSRKLRIVNRDQCSLVEEISPKAVDVLCYEISTLCRDKKELALEVAAEIRERISDLQVAVDSLQRMETDMEAQIIAVEKDKANVQQSLENELQRRENEWAAKLEKIKREEKLMRERVLEMAEERVGLQKAIASYKVKEASWKSKMKESEVSLQILKQKSQQKDSDIADFKSALTDMSNRLNLTDSELDNSCKKNVLLEMENAGLEEDLSRLQRMYEDQQLTIGELWQELSVVVNQPCNGKIASRKRLQRELLRLTEVESKLRNEVDALRSELKFLKLREGSGCPLEGGEELDQNLQGSLVNLHMQTATGDVERVPLGTSSQPIWQHDLHQGSKVPCSKLRRGMENADLWHIFAVLESQGLPKDVLQRAWKALSCSFLKQEGQILNEDVVGGSLASQLLEKLLAANKQMVEFEDQLDKREEEIELLQQQLQENVKELSDLRMELSRVIKERDEFRSEAADITRQATRLTIEIAELRELAERLDEELMLREGQISILRGAYSESDP